jgi:DNA mismatch endonuclease (patch repair protein)
MADILSRAGRSALMAKVRGRGNATTELALARIFRATGLTGWRRQFRLAGGRGDEAWKVRPDFVFPRRRWVVFVDGCFWHGCPAHGTRPAGNAAFWRRKFAANQARDRRNTRQLRAAGWRVLRLWEHELRRAARAGLLRKLRRLAAGVPANKKPGRQAGSAGRTTRAVQRAR